MILIYQLYPRARGRHYLRFGLNLESDLGREATLNLGLNHVWFPINAWDGQLRTEAQIGDTTRFGTELYQPIDARDWFFAMPFVNYELRGGIAHLNGHARRDTGDPNVFQSEEFSGGVYGAVLEYDTLDDVRFPNDGSYARAESFWFRKDLGFVESFERVSVQANTFRTWRKNTIGIGLTYATSIDAGPRLEVQHTLGGFLNHSGFARNSLVGQHTGLARLVTYRRIASPAVFAWEFPVYLGGLFEIGNAWDDRSDIDNDLLISAGPFVGVDTPLGPLYLAYAYGEGGENRGYLFLARSC